MFNITLKVMISGWETCNSLFGLLQLWSNCH